MMSKQHFAAVAKMFRDTRPAAYTLDLYALRAWDSELVDQWLTLVEQYADLAKQSNPRFNRAKFLTACGAQDGGFEIP